MNLSQLDFNSLLILQTLLEEKHVSNTALSLNTSQSSVSRVLQKMRKFFNDELMVRSNYGYELTSKAEAIKLDLNSVITGMERLVNNQEFYPEKVSSVVKFFGLQPQIDALMPKFLSKVRQSAPNLTVSIDTTPKRHFEDLIAGNVHFVLSAHQPPSSEQNIYRMKLADRTFRLLMSKSHPLAEKELTVDNLLDCHFGQISLQGEQSLSFEDKFKKIGRVDKSNKMSVPVQVANFNSAPAIAAETDIIFHLPTIFAERACKHLDVVAREVPEQLRLDFSQVYLYWHKRFHNDPLNNWIREQFKQLFVDKGVCA